MTPNAPIVSASSAAAAPSSADPTTAAGIASTHGQVNSGTKINSLEDLKRKAPQVYKAMMMSIQEMIRQDMQHHADRLKEALRGNQ